MTSAFSWQYCISLCPASFHIPRPNLPVTPGVSWLPTFAFQSPIMKRTTFGVLVLKCLVGLHRTIQLQLLQCYWLGHRLGLLWYWMSTINIVDRLAYECPGVSRGGMGQKWLATGLAALSQGVWAPDLLKEVTIIFITSTIVLPQVKQQGGNRAPPINRKSDLRQCVPTHQSKTQFLPQSVSPIRKPP